MTQRNDKPANRFANSFRKIVGPLKRGEKCRLKRHFTGAAREVMGYLEHQAERPDVVDRFLYVKVETIVRHCNRFQFGKRLGRAHDYSKSAVEKALAYLCAQKIISERHSNQFGYRGFVVAPHDALCQRHGRECRFTGPHLKVPVRWERNDETGVIWRPPEKT